MSPSQLEFWAVPVRQVSVPGQCDTRDGLLVRLTLSGEVAVARGPVWHCRLTGQRLARMLRATQAGFRLRACERGVWVDVEDYRWLGDLEAGGVAVCPVEVAP